MSTPPCPFENERTKIGSFSDFTAKNEKRLAEANPFLKAPHCEPCGGAKP
jgi:hypothetical protein